MLSSHILIMSLNIVNLAINIIFYLVKEKFFLGCIRKGAFE